MTTAIDLDRPPRPPQHQQGRPGEVARSWLAGDAGRRPGRGTLPPQALIIMASLNILAAVLFGFLAHITIVGTLKHNRDQQVAYDGLRLALAEGTGPVGPVEGEPLPLGVPLARIAIPALGMKEVVLEGTTAGVLSSGVGHRRDTVLPGQAGVSILMGRRMIYGGPFSRLADLAPGDAVEVVTGQGVATYKVLGTRVAGDPGPPPLPEGGSRITLMTSAGPRFAPTGVLRVDAERDSPGAPAATPAFTAATLPAAEAAMAKEGAALGPASAWGLLLVAAATATAWLRARWGRWQAWLVAVPTLGFLGITVADHTARLLPNLM